jgi:hypothetical protein
VVVACGWYWYKLIKIMSFHWVKMFCLVYECTIWKCLCIKRDIAPLIQSIQFVLLIWVPNSKVMFVCFCTSCWAVSESFVSWMKDKIWNSNVSWSVRASSYIPISRPTDAICNRLLFSINMCITLHVSSVKRSSSGIPHCTYSLQFLCLCLSAALSCKKLSFLQDSVSV